MRGKLTALALVLALTLAGCSSLLERSWSTVTPHSAGYRDDTDREALRVESYQELVNALLMLVASREESGVVRLYGGEETERAQLAADACSEVQQESDLGAYLLDYITYSGEAERDCYELTLSFGYRRTAEEQEALINATSTEALPDLVRAAVRDGAQGLAVRVGYFAADRDGVTEQILAVQTELAGLETATQLALPWEISFYPAVGDPGIVEIRFY